MTASLTNVVFLFDIRLRLPNRTSKKEKPGFLDQPGLAIYVFFGTSATNRMDVVNVSSWKCGRNQATASYQPGLPLTSRTSTRASDSGFFAFSSSVALSGL